MADRICLGVDNLALGVAMIGAMLAQPGRIWQDVLELLDDMDLAEIQADFGEAYPHPNLLAAIQVSIDDLPDESTKQRYRELAIFAGRGPFSRSAVEALWGQAGLTGAAVGAMLATLTGRSLLTDEGDGRFGAHDLQHEVAAKQLGPTGLQQAHRRLVAGYTARCPAGWASGPNDGYFLEHLTFHLAHADQRDELADVLTDLDWMRLKLIETGIAGLLADYEHDLDNAVGMAMHVTLQLAASIIATDPDQLPSQLVGRLISHPDAAIRNVVESIQGSTVGVWLCPITPPNLASPDGPQRHILRGHTDWAVAVAVSPDNLHIVSARWDQTVRVWDLASGRELARWTSDHPVLAVDTAPTNPLKIAIGEQVSGAVYALRLRA